MLKIIFVLANIEEPNGGLSSGSLPFTKVPVHILESLIYKEIFFKKLLQSSVRLQLVWIQANVLDCSKV